MKKSSSFQTQFLRHFEFTMSSKSTLSYSERAKQQAHPVARRLFQIAQAKKSNVVVSADVTTTKELLELADGK